MPGTRGPPRGRVSPPRDSPNHGAGEFMVGLNRHVPQTAAPGSSPRCGWWLSSTWKSPGGDQWSGGRVRSECLRSEQHSVGCGLQEAAEHAGCLGSRHSRRANGGWKTFGCTAANHPGLEEGRQTAGDPSSRDPYHVFQTGAKGASPAGVGSPSHSELSCSTDPPSHRPPERAFRAELE